MTTSEYEKRLHDLKRRPKTWLVTGVAGFIGSNILEQLLQLNQRVIGLDNLETGYVKNLRDVENSVSTNAWANFSFMEGDITDFGICEKACLDVDFVLHQAALGSVPRSVNDPIATNLANVTGFLNMLVAAKKAKVGSFVYAASSSTYGDLEDLPKVEPNIGNPLSPYAVTKYVNELYAGVFARAYNFKSIGLRYFNVFGKRQDPRGAYAAVIPKWVASMMANEMVQINGDGETSRDFCYVENVVQANILAATAPEIAKNEVYNIAVGARTTLNELFDLIRDELRTLGVLYDKSPSYLPFREGDVRHSLADVNKARRLLGFKPMQSVEIGLPLAMKWYVEQ